jgi:AcrR family transcriptional regulator
MSPKKNSSISDRESETKKLRRGRPAVPPELVLNAADALFADAKSPATVTMDDIAAAAGVGKGTLFRAFGSREGLLHALWAAKVAALRADIQEGRSLGAGTSSRERAVGFLDALLLFKLRNTHLIRALAVGAGVLKSRHYQWMHGLLQHFIEDASPGAKPGDALFTAHVLLGGLHIDLVEALIAGGLSLEAIRQAQAAHVRAVIGGGLEQSSGAETAKNFAKIGRSRTQSHTQKRPHLFHKE